MRRKSRRKTIFSLLGALGIAATVFMYFQFFSLEMIDDHKRESDNNDPAHLPVDGSINVQKNDKNIKQAPGRNIDNESWKNPDHGNSKDCDSAECDSKGEESKLDAQDNIAVGDKLGVHDELRVVDKVGLDNAVLMGQNIEDMWRIESNDVLKDLPRGAHRKLASAYKPDDNQMFTCLLSEEQVPYSQVNDDYCDCSDGSDEPGTAACVDNRFYCTFQGMKEHHIPSSQVNDGICDCCDGSDEWMNKTLPDHVKLDDRPYYGYYQSPCKNHCQQEVGDAKKLLAIQKQGADMKRDYVKAAQGQPNPAMLYGPDGAYFTLSKSCYETKSDKYEYKVCPFKEVRQQAFPEPSTLIGQIPQWIQSSDDDYKTLRMSGGDIKQCPGLIKRESIIKFECGILDQVISVQETEVCQYTIIFTTPAAC